MKLTPETIDAALNEAWGAPWRAGVHIKPGQDPDAYAFKLSCLDPATCDACGDTWEDADMEQSEARGAWVCPECIKWPGNW